ncbi:MAG: tetratricopeptide repeat protein [bacterium]
MAELPVGTVTFFFTDIEASTRLLQHVGDVTGAQVFADHRRLLRDAFQAGGGYEYQDQGESFLIVFQNAKDAVRSAAAAQQAIATHPWPEGTMLRVRMGLHTGEPVVAADGYVGLDVHRAARICAAGYGGQILISKTTWALIRDDLPDSVVLKDLGEHRLKDLARPERIYQVIIPGLPADFPPLKSLDLLTNNLPSLQLTSFIGREREMTEIKLLLSTARLVTLQGPGGTGKTRIALHAAADLIEHFPDGVWLAELAPLSDPALLPQTVATVFSVREQPGRAFIDSLVDYLRAKELLLVLDNCEHLVESSAHLAHGLLLGCPKLRILATSREILSTAGEVVYRVPPLARPDPRRVLSLEGLTQFDAARLFMERAVLSKPSFVVTDTNAPAVAQVCHRLDGIPLAIELAAARVKVLSVEQIAQRLDDRFRLLTGGQRAALPHHQTLQATVEWSYDLLSEQERLLFRRLSVFAGGFTLEAAEAVCAGEGIGEFDVLDLLARLIDKSLALTEELHGDIRYRLLETIRHYSRERLEESGEADLVRRRHLEWHMGLAEQAEPELRGFNQIAWLDRLEIDHDDLRAALEWSKTVNASGEMGLRLAGALYRFWGLRGYLSEGRHWLDTLLAISNGGPQPRIKALHGAGVLAYYQGDYKRATTLCEEALALSKGLGDERAVAATLTILGNVARNRGEYARAAQLYEESLVLCQHVGDKWGLANTMSHFGNVVRSQGNYPRAKGLLEESLALWREVGDKWGLATCLSHLGTVMGNQGDYDRAIDLHEESLALRRELRDKVNVGASLMSLGAVALNRADYERAQELFEETLSLRRELGDKPSVAGSLGNLGIVAYYLGDYDRAAGLLEESLTLWRELGAEPGVATALNVLGRVVHAQGDQERAGGLFRESLTLYAKHGDKRGIAWALEGLARVAGASGHPERAARLFGAAHALREAIGDPLPPRDRGDYERGVNAVRALLDEQRFTAAWAQGREMPLDQAVEQGLAPDG